MLTASAAVRVFIATQPIDCRKSFDGLSLAVSNILELDPTSGHYFVFFNRRGNQARVLFWDRTGWCVLAKRLARGTFRLATIASADAASVEVEAAELALILEGIELAGAQRRARFRLAPAESAAAE